MLISLNRVLGQPMDPPGDAGVTAAAAAWLDALAGAGTGGSLAEVDRATWEKTSLKAAGVVAARMVPSPCRAALTTVRNQPPSMSVTRMVPGEGGAKPAARVMVPATRSAETTCSADRIRVVAGVGVAVTAATVTVCRVLCVRVPPATYSTTSRAL